MASNKRAKETPEMRESKKRPKIDQQQGAAAPACCFEDLNNDCLVQTLSFLETEEMNDSTLINSRVCEARNDPSLDQTRSATIIVRSKKLNILDFYEMIASRKWAQGVFLSNSNKQVLKIVGCENLTKPRDVEMARLRSQSFDVQLPSVTRLEVSALDTNRKINDHTVLFLFRSLPKLQEANIINSGAGGTPRRRRAASMLSVLSRSIFRDNPVLMLITRSNHDGSLRQSIERPVETQYKNLLLSKALGLLRGP